MAHKNLLRAMKMGWSRHTTPIQKHYTTLNTLQALKEVS